MGITTLRNNFKAWIEEAKTVAVNQYTQHAANGALTLVATDVVWEQQPENKCLSTVYTS
jgi:hypothetical protein